MIFKYERFFKGNQEVVLLPTVKLVDDKTERDLRLKLAAAKEDRKTNNPYHVGWAG